MRYHVLATDYDGTLASQGAVDGPTVDALKRLRQSGRKLILVTGRELDDVLQAFPEAEEFDQIVAENGAVLYRPSSRRTKVLGQPPPQEFIRELGKRGVTSLAVGQVIVSTSEPNQNKVLQAIRDLGLELHVIFNKGSVMVLPSGINKASGLSGALRELGFSPHNVVAIGDAENDHALLKLCEFSVAVANALPALQDQADLVTGKPAGDGVIELIDRLLESEAALAPRPGRHSIVLGKTPAAEEVRIDSYDGNILVIGAPGSGKSTLATGFMEQLSQQAYQFCVVDPEGDYGGLSDAIALGDDDSPPAVEEIRDLLEKSMENATINLTALRVEDRPAFFERLFPLLLELRNRKGRPHWIVIDETHHMLPPYWARAKETLPPGLRGMMLITVEPETIEPAFLSLVNMALVAGPAPDELVHRLAAKLGEGAPEMPAVGQEGGNVLAWPRGSGAATFWFHPTFPEAEHQRHRRKYAQGELGPERSFYFQGPEGKLNLRAQNLMSFIQLADGVDDDTWMFHLRRGDYSRWIEREIRDEDLANEVKRVETNEDYAPRESRARIRSIIRERYTAPAEHLTTPAGEH